MCGGGSRGVEEERKKIRGMQVVWSFAIKGVRNGNSGQLALGSRTESVWEVRCSSLGARRR